MALPTIAITDFTGQIALSANKFTALQLQAYVDSFLPKYIRELLSPAAYVQMSTTNDVKWDRLNSGGDYDYVEAGTDKVGYSPGFRKVLLYLIYFQIVRDDFSMTDTGAVVNTNENSTRVRQYNIAQDRYNKGVAFYNEVLLYLFRVKALTQGITQLIDNTGTFTVRVDNLAQESLLANGDVVTMDDVEYTVFNKSYDENTFIELFDVTAVALTATEYTFSPYTKVETSYLYPQYL
jgi:hypothetical protein